MEFYKLGQGKQAYNSLDKGKTISFKPSSLRYSYDEQENSNTQKTWKPKTAEEKKTLAPKNYYRLGDRENEKNARLKGIYENALKEAQKEYEQKKNSVFESELKKANEAQNKKFFGLGKIFTSAKKRAMIAEKAKEKANEIVKDDTEEKAKNKADKIFNEEYHEKQISVPSTAIADIRYNPTSEILKVKFQGGKKLYTYRPGVPIELIQRWLKAPSKGEFFMRNIHDQYSLYGKNHRPKNASEVKGILHYVKKAESANKNRKVGSK